jgi:hypothetical protein
VNCAQFVEAAKAGRLRIGGTGSKQEDQIIAAAVGHVGELRAGRAGQRGGDDLVFLLGAGAADPQAPGLRGLDELPDVLPGALGIHPEHELVERHHRDRRQVAPVEGHAGGQRRGEEVGEGDDQHMRVAAGRLRLEEAFRAGAAGLVHHHDGLAHQLVLGDDALDDAGHLVGAATGARRHDELHGAGRRPAALRRGTAATEGQRGRRTAETERQLAARGCHRHHQASSLCRPPAPVPLRNATKSVALLAGCGGNPCKSKKIV